MFSPTLRAVGQDRRFAHRADAERPIRHSHAERGNEHRAHESARAVVDLQIEDTNGTALKAPTVLTSRSHALRGNVLPDAPRRRTGPTLCSSGGRRASNTAFPRGAWERASRERKCASSRRPPDRRHEWHGLEGTKGIDVSFPRSAWECSPRRSAPSDRTDALLIERTQSVQYGIPTRSVGTSIGTRKWRAVEAPQIDDANDAALQAFDLRRVARIFGTPPIRTQQMIPIHLTACR